MFSLGFLFLQNLFETDKTRKKVVDHLTYSVRYSLTVSIETPGLETENYSVMKELVNVDLDVQVEIPV